MNSAGCPPGQFSDELFRETLPVMPCGDTVVALVVPLALVVGLRTWCAFYFVFWWMTRRGDRLLRQQLEGKHMYPHGAEDSQQKRGSWVDDAVVPVTAGATLGAALVQVLLMLLVCLDVANGPRNDMVTHLLGALCVFWGLEWLVTCEKLILVGIRLDRQLQGRTPADETKRCNVAYALQAMLVLTAGVWVSAVTVGFLGNAHFYFLLLGVEVELLVVIIASQLQKLWMTAQVNRSPHGVTTTTATTQPAQNLPHTNATATGGGNTGSEGSSSSHMTRIQRSIRYQQAAITVLGSLGFVVFTLVGSGRLRVSWKAMLGVLVLETTMAVFTAVTLPRRGGRRLWKKKKRGEGPHPLGPAYPHPHPHHGRLPPRAGVSALRSGGGERSFQEVDVDGTRGAPSGRVHSDAGSGA